MKKERSYIGVFGIVSAFLLTGCYSQLQTVHYTGYGPEVSPDRAERIAQAEREIREGERTVSADPEESYLYGYEDGLDDGYTEGWGDAELYYFKDYETAQWFREHGFTLSTGKRTANYYNYYFHSGHYPYYGRYWHARNYYSPRWRVHFRYGNWYHLNYRDWYYYDLAWYGYPYSWHYYRYPHYDPFYYGYPYYGSSFVFHSNHYYGLTPSTPGRVYMARSSGMSSSSELNRNRPRNRFDTTGNGTSAVRSGGVSASPQQQTRTVSTGTAAGRSTGSAVRTGTPAARTPAVQRSSGSTVRTPANSPAVRGNSPERSNRSSGTIQSRQPLQGERIQSSGSGDRNEVSSTGVRERVTTRPASGVERSRLNYPAPYTDIATQTIHNRIHTQSVERETGLRAPVQNVNRPSGWSRLGNIILDSQGYHGNSPGVQRSQPAPRSSSQAPSVNRSSGGSTSSGTTVRSSSGSGSTGNVRSSGSSSNNRSRGN